MDKLNLINFNYILFLTFNSGLGYFYFGYNSTVFNAIGNNLTDVFKWTKDEKLFFLNAMNSVLPLGALIGSIQTGFILKRFGRRKTLMMNCLFSSVGNILTLIPEANIMIVGRLIVGLGVGIFSVSVP